MLETRCHRCGAVFPAGSGAMACPHCGTNPQTIYGKIWSRISRYVGLAAGLVAYELFRHWHENRLSSWVSGLLVVAVTAGWAIWKDTERNGPRQSFGLLNMRLRRAHGTETKPALVSSAPPDTPPEWRRLLEQARPRDVYLPASAKMKIILEAFIAPAAVAFAIVYFWRIDPELRSEFSFHRANLVIAAIILVVVWRSMSPVLKELSARALLRDGDVTIGLITGRRSGIHGIPEVTYQFWTCTGKRFEHTEYVLSEKRLYAEKDFVPVFYPPEDPSKSLALCCTSSRVKLMEASVSGDARHVSPGS